MEKKLKPVDVGTIGNYYGGLKVMEYHNKYYWIIENYDNNIYDIDRYEEIPESLYNELIKFEKKRKRSEIG